nr:glutathione S-transferase family protein [uncultured Hyphomonas sp.]
MSAYRLFGAETSPYSLKVRAFLRYKGIEFEWVTRSRETETDFRALARHATVPLLVSPDRPVSQESTRMLFALESSHPEPSATPDDPALAALSLILEDYGDEWLNKCMFQQRWSSKPDRDQAGLRALVQLSGGKRPRAWKKPSVQIAERMADRLPLVGASSENGPVLDASWRRFAELLNTHLKDHLFIFGGRPAFADFSLAAQLQQMLLDPTPAEWLKDRAPFVVAWCENMDDPKAGGPFADLSALQPTLAPLFADEVGKTYLVWARANTNAARKGADKVSAELEGGQFEQSTQKHAAEAFNAVDRSVSRTLKNSGALETFLGDAGCLKAFRYKGQPAASDA